MNPAGQPDPTTQYGQLKSAILGGQQAGGGVSIIGNSPELAKLYGAQGLNPSDIGSAKIAGSSYNAGVQVANAKAAADASLKAQQDMLDPSKYRQVAAQDGGFNFFAPNGQQISASQYAQITNKSVADVLKNSQNPIDKSFQQDYKQLEQYIADKQNSKGAKINADGTQTGNVKALRGAQAIEALVKKQYGIDLAKENPSDVGQTFMKAYPTVFGLQTTGPQGTGYFLPSSGAASSYVKTQYPSLDKTYPTG